MKRIGVLGVDALSEKLIAGFFQAETGAQVFLSPANSERAQRLARKFPCWTLDNHQADAPRDKCGHSGAINHGHTCCRM